MYNTVINLSFVLFLARHVVCQQYFIHQPAAFPHKADYNQNYNANFHAEPEPEPEVDTVDYEKLERDPYVKHLFREFLNQYQDIIVKDTAQATTTQAPLTVTNPPRPVFQHVQNKPVQQRRRISSKKTNSPSRIVEIPSSTPSTTLLKHTSLQIEETVDDSHHYHSRKQNFFGLHDQTINEPKNHRHQNIPRRAQTTPKPIENVEVFPSSTIVLPHTPISHVHIPLSHQKSAPKPVYLTTPTPSKPEHIYDETEFRRQAENAKYEFASNIDDEINGNLHQREEVRDGLAVKGKYSYSDGYYKRTVHYEADENGYRVVKEDVEPLEGPQANPNGQAKVSTYVGGNVVNYQITKDDIAKKEEKIVYDDITFEEFEDENK